VRDAIAFVIFAVLWTLVGRLALMAGIQPVALAAVWLFGFVWGVGYILDGIRSADRLTLAWLGTIGGAFAVASLAVTAIS
jgi:hypothetical protein